MISEQDRAIFKIIFKPIKKVFDSSVFFHAVVLTVAIAIFCTYTYVKPNINLENEYISILNTIGILSTFIIFVSERVEIKDLLHMKKKVTIRRFGKEVTTTESDYLINTFMSFITIELILLAIQYVLLVFDLVYMFLLIWSIIYLIFGFLLIIGIWHGIAIYKK